MSDAMTMSPNPSTTDFIRKDIFISASPSRVWRALTDYREFAAWFGAELAAPFRAGGTIRGPLTIEGVEHVTLEAKIVELTPETRFVYTWHPYAIDPEKDYSDEPPTTVTLTLTPEGSGTRVAVIETGFDAIPAYRKAEALRANTNGWEFQLGRLARYAAA